MKTVKLTSPPPSLADLLALARDDVVMVTTEEGDSFVISAADDFETEVQLLRRNRTFLNLLDQWKQDEDSIPLDEAEETLR